MIIVVSLDIQIYRMTKAKVNARKCFTIFFFTYRNISRTNNYKIVTYIHTSNGQTQQNQ